MELKTEESKATLPLPRATVADAARAQGAHARADEPALVRVRHPRRQAARTAQPAARALHARRSAPATRTGRPTFPELFEHDERGHLVVDERGDVRARATSSAASCGCRTFHALRHGAAMDCDDAEEARDLLRHKNSNVTRAIYRAHFGDRRRELLRARMEARMETRMETSDRRAGAADDAAMRARKWRICGTFAAA